MNLVVRKNELHGSISVPGSKSHTIRAVAIASMAEGTSRIRSPLLSEDTLSAVNAARQFGAVVERGDDSVWSIRGVGGRIHTPKGIVDMRNSGTSIKIFAALASLSASAITFDGDESLRSRPMGPLLDALEQRGVKTASKSGKCPFQLTGPLCGGEVTVDCESSQFVTAMLMSLPLVEDDSVIHVENINEQPYLEITLKWLDKTGIRFKREEDLTRFEIPGKQRYRAFDLPMPADFSTAAFPLVAAAVTGSELEIENLDFSDTQGDKAVFAHLETMGMEIIRTGTITRLKPHGRLHAAELDLNATPDALPALSVAAAYAEGTTVLKNVAQARIKETDRIACMTKELRKMGAQIEEFEDGMSITGGTLTGTALQSYKDHRIAMALAVAGLGAEGETIIRGAECAAVTYPGFIRDFNRLGANFKEF